MELEWSPIIDAGNVLAAIGFLFTGVSVFFAGWELKRNATASRATLFLELSKRYFADGAIRNLYYKIDWREFEFDPRHLPTGEDERVLDKLLYTFDEIGHLLKIGALKKDEARLFAFQAARVLRDPQVQSYLEYLDGDYAKEGIEKAHVGARHLLAKVTSTRRARNAARDVQLAGASGP